MDTPDAIKGAVERVKKLQARRDTLVTAIDEAESRLRNILHLCHDILLLSRKFELNKFVDEQMEITSIGETMVSVTVRNVQVLLGTMSSQYGGFHLVINRCDPSVLKPEFTRKLEKIKKKLEGDLIYQAKFKRRAEEAKLIVERDKLEKDLTNEVRSLETKAKALGITKAFEVK